MSAGPEANSGSDSNGVANTGPTSTVVDPPVQTAGAFLVCRADIEPMPDPTMAMGGCKLVKDDTKYDAWRADFMTQADVVPEDENRAFGPEIQSAMSINPIDDDFDAWHWRVTYPRSAPLMQFRLQITPVAGGASETVRAFFKGQEWFPIDDEDAILRFSSTLPPNGRDSFVESKSSSDEERFFMVPPSIKATLRSGSTDGVIMTFTGVKPIAFGPCRLVPVGSTEVASGGAAPPPAPGDGEVRDRKRTTTNEVTVYFEMVDGCPDVQPGQIRRMKEVELRIERPKEVATELLVNFRIQALQQRRFED